ncbi:hypothetical protein [[Eubacterium] cellulosolvens]
MKTRSTTLTILSAALVALILLIGWSFVGPALGGSGTGSSDSPEDKGAPGPDSPGPDDPNPDYPRPNPPPPPDPKDDSDGDFIPDDAEPYYETDQYDWDSDNDHLADGNEPGGTDPNLKDTDNDGI